MADFRDPKTETNMNVNMAEMFRTGGQDPNSNAIDEKEKLERKLSDYSVHEQDASFPVQGIPPAVASDPLLRQAYTMPAAGLTLPPQNFDQSSSPSSRYYKMASDIFGTGMDKSWTASPAPPTTAQHGGTGNQTPNNLKGNSFKITEIPTTPTAAVSEDLSGNFPAGRRARESSGNPLTGQGFNPENAKTGKRYFEGSNANQKLW